jgi:hypothetical protein
MNARMRSRCGLLLCGLALSACRPKQGEDLSVAQLSAVVAGEQDSLTPCYQTGLEKNPYPHEFRIQAVLEIRADGQVSKVELDQTGLPGVGPCLEKAIRGWKFPRAKAATRASLPIVFKPKVVQDLPANFKLPPGFKVLQQQPTDGP